MTFTFSFVINFNIDQSIYLFTIQKYSIEKIIISLLYVYIFYFQIFYLKPSKIFLRNMKSAKFVYIYIYSIGKKVAQTRIEISEQLERFEIHLDSIKTTDKNLRYLINYSTIQRDFKVFYSFFHSI